MKVKSNLVFGSIHIIVLFNFAIAQPLFNLLSRNTEFFVAHHSKPVDVLFLIFSLCFLLPIFLVFLEVLTILLGSRFHRIFQYFVLTGLLTILALPVFEKVSTIPGPAIIALSIAICLILTLFYFRYQTAKTFLTILAPAILIFPILFLFNSPVFKIVFTNHNAAKSYPQISATAPIFMVIFDEFPIASLLGEHNQIDPKRYPNFADFSKSAYWFRNATTVCDSTQYAVPSILTGNYPQMPRLPIAANYPNNIFTLFGGSYNLKVFEPVTELCPKNLSDRMQFTFLQRMNQLLSDLAIVYLHLLIPDDYRSCLPDVTKTWKDFKNQTQNQRFQLVQKASAAQITASQQFEQYLTSISATSRPTLYFLHVMLPHYPWIYSPSGKRYSMTDNARSYFNGRKWVTDEALVIQGYQRHLLQVGFVDHLLGIFLKKLKDTNLFDRALIVVTADHGVSFRPGVTKRVLTNTNYPDIIYVPLFIKAPNQSKGIVSDQNIETIDILPTIADILSIPIPWQTDGHSALSNNPQKKNEKIAFKVGGNAPFIFKDNPKVVEKIVEHKLNLFGTGNKKDGLFKIGPFSELIGKPSNSFKIAHKENVKVRIDQINILEDFSTKADYFPGFITGKVLMAESLLDSFNLAISLNGTIWATTKPSFFDKGQLKFSAFIPEESFCSGKNNIEVFLVTTSVDRQIQLELIEKVLSVTYTLKALNPEKESFLLSSNGKHIPVIPGTVKGYLDKAIAYGDVIKFEGWAFDSIHSQFPESILIFTHGKSIYAGQNNLERPDVAKIFGKASLLCGFSFEIPKRLIKNLDSAEVNFFAIAKNGAASELSYFNGYKWKKK